MRQIFAELISIGDELLYGQTLDTNAHWISQQLDLLGIKILRRHTIGDIEEEILSTFKMAEERADVILITGGLGPTNDDLTMPTLAKYFDVPIEINEEALKEVEAFIHSKGREMSERNRKQGLMPKGSWKITNNIGTAPGIWMERNNKVFVSMPGVPHEMRAMMTETVIPRIKEKFQTSTIYHQMIKTVGIGESWLADLIKDWEEALPKHIKLAYLPSTGEVKLRLTAVGDDKNELKKEVDQQVDELKKLAGKYIYGYGDITLEEAIGQMLKEKNLTIALAESCSGGFVSHKITSVAGSSAYYQGSIVPYHNELKKEVLHVAPEAIDQHGAVSEETVKEMAKNVRQMMHADIGVASSGVAGPTGGTAEKPVGTVWIAFDDGEHTYTKKLQLGNDRLINIHQTATHLMNMVRISLNKEQE